MITLKNCTVFQQDKQLLHRIDLHLAESSCLVVIGESGAGKSILSKLILNHLPKSCHYTGEIMRSFQRVAYVVQNPMSTFNTFQTIASHFYELFGSLANRPVAEMKKQAIYLLEQVGLSEDVLFRYPFELSGGQLQRIMFALALASDADFYLLDEPTSALDSGNTLVIQDIILKLKAAGKTIMLVTHDYDLAQQVGDNIMILKNGSLYAYGSVTEVLTQQDEYSQMLIRNPYTRLVQDATS